MELVGSAGRDDADLSTGALAVLGSVGIGDNVEFAYSVHAQKLSAGSARRQIDLRCARVFDSVEEEQILLRSAPGDGEHVSHRGIGSSHAARACRGIIDDRRVEQHQLVVAAAVQREILHLRFSDQSGSLLGGGVHRRRLRFHRDRLLYLA